MMPSHAVIGLVVSQFSEAVPRRVSLAARSVSQSAIRLESSGSGIAAVLAHDVVCAITGMGASPMVIIKAVMASVLLMTMRAARVIPRVGGIPFHVEHLYGGG